jgi:hypothetical protein
MKRSMIGTAVAGTLFLAASGAYLWWYSAVAVASAQAQSLANDITTRSRAELRITAARTTLANLALAESTVAGYFVAQANIVPFIEQLQTLGAASGATVSVLSVSAGTGAANPPITISLSISGTFDHVARAVGAIEYAPYDLTVSSLTITQTKDKKSWQAGMIIVVGSTGSAAALPAAPMPSATTTQSTDTASTTASTSSPQAITP